MYHVYVSIRWQRANLATSSPRPPLARARNATLLLLAPLGGSVPEPLHKGRLGFSAIMEAQSTQKRWKGVGLGDVTIINKPTLIG